MGAWGIKAFENDTACDWAYELEESSDLSVIEKALDTILEQGEEEIDATAGEEALAASEVVAMLLGNIYQSDSCTETVEKWVKENRIKPSFSLVAKCHQVIDRILTEPSELLELWEDSDEGEAWKSEMTNLRARLTP